MSIYRCYKCKRGFDDTNNPNLESIASTAAGRNILMPCPLCGADISIYEASRFARGEKVVEPTEKADLFGRKLFADRSKTDDSDAQSSGLSAGAIAMLSIVGGLAVLIGVLMVTKKARPTEKKSLQLVIFCNQRNLTPDGRREYLVESTLIRLLSGKNGLVLKQRYINPDLDIEKNHYVIELEPLEPAATVLSIEPKVLHVNAKNGRSFTVTFGAAKNAPPVTHVIRATATWENEDGDRESATAIFGIEINR